jgi:hypothetical protein
MLKSMRETILLDLVIYRKIPTGNGGSREAMISPNAWNGANTHYFRLR